MNQLLLIFPNLKNELFKITSPIDTKYNCIAFAAGDTEKIWWPDPMVYWPKGIERQNSLLCFIKAFNTKGYNLCKSIKYIPGYEKVVIYIKEDGTPGHMARQLPNGFWISKCGKLHDIQHLSLECLSIPDYGKPKKVLRRKIDKITFVNFLKDFFFEKISRKLRLE